MEHLELPLIIIKYITGVKNLNYAVAFQKLSIYLYILMYIGL